MNLLTKLLQPAKSKFWQVSYSNGLTEPLDFIFPVTEQHALEVASNRATLFGLTLVSLSRQ